jgi:hypothetical protein
MRDVMRRVPCFRRALCFLDLIGQSDPRLRHIRQRNFAPAIRKPLSDFEAMGGVQPVARYDFAGRHPHPQYVFSNKPDHGRLFRIAKKKFAGKLSWRRSTCRYVASNLSLSAR